MKCIHPVISFDPELIMSYSKTLIEISKISNVKNSCPCSLTSFQRALPLLLGAVLQTKEGYVGIEAATDV